MQSDFNLHVLDNFLSDDAYTEAINLIPTIDWGAKTLKYNGLDNEHRWFSSHLAPHHPIAVEIEKNIKEKTKFKFRGFRLLAFTMVPKMEPFPHVDLDDGSGHTNQLVLYIDGNTEMNKGTGFYVQDSKTNINLNTHIGFHKNRAILFKSGMYHSPLLFLSNDSIPRISIIARF